MNRKKTDLGTGNHKLTPEELHERGERELAKAYADDQWVKDEPLPLPKLFIEDTSLAEVHCEACVNEVPGLSKEVRPLTLRDCEDSCDVDDEGRAVQFIQPQCCECGHRTMYSLLPEK